MEKKIEERASRHFGIFLSFFLSFERERERLRKGCILEAGSVTKSVTEREHFGKWEREIREGRRKATMKKQKPINQPL